MASEMDVKGGWRHQARSENPRRISLRVLRATAAEYPATINAADPAPGAYGECLERGLGVTRPCPHAGCGYHLALDVSEGGSIVHRWPDRDAHEVPETCALAVAARGPQELETIGRMLGISRERVRQIEGRFLRRLKRTCEAWGLTPETLAPEARGDGSERLPDVADVRSVRPSRAKRRSP